MIAQAFGCWDSHDPARSWSTPRRATITDMTTPDQAQYRAELDFEITFANGGRLSGEGFRIDIAGPDLGDDELGASLIRDLGLLMADEVRISQRRIFPDRHKRAVPRATDTPPASAAASAPSAPSAPSASAAASAPLAPGAASALGAAPRQRLMVTTVRLAALAVFGFLYHPAYELLANPTMLEFAAGCLFGEAYVKGRLPGRRDHRHRPGRHRPVEAHQSGAPGQTRRPGQAPFCGQAPCCGQARFPAKARIPGQPDGLRPGCVPLTPSPVRAHAETPRYFPRHDPTPLAPAGCPNSSTIFSPGSNGPIKPIPPSSVCPAATSAISAPVSWPGAQVCPLNTLSPPATPTM